MVDDKDRFDIIVNGRRKVVTESELTYDEVVRLALDPPPVGPNWMITVSFRNGAGRPPEGTLVEGQQVKVKDGTVFVVTATDKS